MQINVLKTDMSPVVSFFHVIEFCMTMHAQIFMQIAGGTKRTRQVVLENADL